MGYKANLKLDMIKEDNTQIRKLKPPRTDLSSFIRVTYGSNSCDPKAIQIDFCQTFTLVYFALNHPTDDILSRLFKVTLREVERECINCKLLRNASRKKREVKMRQSWERD